MFSKADISLIDQKGITLAQVNEQIEFFRKGIPFLHVVRPATANDGIVVPDESQIRELEKVYENRKKGKTILKFVPASGAATRMFKSLFEESAKIPGSAMANDVAQVIKNLEKFAFYNDLREVISKKGLDLSVLVNKSSFNEIISFILNGEGLNYGNLPKGLLKFHTYPEKDRTALEEHLTEGAAYARNEDGSVKLHFTVSPEHLQAFRTLVDGIRSYYEKKLNVTFDIRFSIQKPSTDTIAVDKNDQPFRERDGELIFRPGGHGALLDNLNDLDGDIIFIKNIDNVVPDRLKRETITYKKVLGGLLLQLQQMIFYYLEKLETNQHDLLLYTEVQRFIESKAGYKFPIHFSSMNPDEKKKSLTDVLNRPIRVCGMVKNTGEPGGGPFWVQHDDGSVSLQILESSQFNFQDERSEQIYKSATHFNPVDLVITARNYKGEKFDLRKYRDPKTGFISQKSKDGKELKALELPGLWNGSMAFWNTAFVEVPIATFNPVKSINDLLRTEHQNS